VTGLWVLLLLGVLAVAAGAARHVASSRRRARRRRARSWTGEPRLSRAQAEQRSLKLLRSVVNLDEWEMYRDLGFMCVDGRRPERPGRAQAPGPRYRYLIYPNLPLVALLPRSMAPVREYCIEFPERRTNGEREMLPAGDDMLAKWMTLRSDEEQLLAFANVSSVGCQVPMGQIERDLLRLDRWRRQRAGTPVRLEPRAA
jgi:hypothetical protein